MHWLTERSRERESLQRRIGSFAFPLLDHDQYGHYATPILRIISTTAGAAGGPLPRTSARRPWPAGTTSRATSSLASGRGGVTAATGLRPARIRPGTEGYRGRFKPSLTVSTAGAGTT